MLHPNCKYIEESDNSSDSGDTSSVEDDKVVDSIEETDYKIHEKPSGDVVIEKKQTRYTFSISYDRSDYHASDCSSPALRPALDANVLAKDKPPASNDGARLSRENILRNSEHYHIRSSSKNPRQHAHSGDAKYAPAGRSFVHTQHDFERRLHPYKEDNSTSRPTLIGNWHKDRDETTDNTHGNHNLSHERSFERLRPSRGHVDNSGTIPKENKSHTITRRADGLQLPAPARQFRSGRVGKAAESKDEPLFQTGLIASRRRRHQDSLHDSDNSEPSERGAGRLVRFESRSNVRRPMRRLTGYKSSERTLSRHRDSGHDAQGHLPRVTNDNKGPIILEAQEEEEDVIARELKRYTTFNSDVDLVASPDEADSSGLSDNDTFDMTTLEQAKKTLRRLVEKQEKASKAGDLMTESDLKFYAIPDVEARIQQLTSQPEHGQPEQGLEDHENGG